jgi:hypothetical protein
MGYGIAKGAEDIGLEPIVKKHMQLVKQKLVGLHIQAVLEHRDE